MAKASKGQHKISCSQQVFRKQRPAGIGASCKVTAVSLVRHLEFEEHVMESG